VVLQVDRWTSTYDLQGRVIQERSPTGFINYEYNALGRKTMTQSGTSDSAVLSEERYTYDTLGRLATIQTTLRDGLVQSDKTTQHFDLFGRMDYVELPNSVVEDYQFDNMDRLDVMRHFKSDGNNADLSDNVLKDMFDYSYRADGKRTAVAETFGSSVGLQPVNPVLSNNTFWTYDNAGSLISETLDSSDDTLDQTESYIMDLVGNRLRRTLDKPGTDKDATFVTSVDANDRIQSESRFSGVFATGASSGSATQTTAYTWNGTQQSSKTVSSTGIAPVVSQSMRYGLMGQLEQVTTTSSTSGNVTARTQVRYRYDTGGLRFIAIDATAPASTPDTWTVQSSTEYVLDRMNATGYGQAIIETNKNASGQAIKRTSYTFGQDEIAQTVTEIDPTTGAVTPRETLTFGHDGHGSVRAVLGAAAAISQIYTYSAYGELLAIHNAAGQLQSPTSSLTTLQYNGESFDSRTGLYNFRARWYEASTGRFERLDPYAGNPSDPFSFNKYGFAHGEPVMGTDPSGMFVWTLLGLGLRLAFVGAQIYFGFTSAVKIEGSFKPLAKIGPRQKQQALEYAWLTVASYKASEDDGNLQKVIDLGWEVEWTSVDNNNGYRAVLFRHDQTARRVLAYAGTDDTPDLFTDAWQGLLGGSTQYMRAVTDSLSAKAKFGPIDRFTGHSLGGGLASLAALSNRKPALTYNAAGLHSWTADIWNVDLDRADNTIKAYRVQGDFLSTIQDASAAYLALGLVGGYVAFGAAILGLAGAIMPNGVGQAFWVRPTSHSIWNRHKMLSDVIPGIERA
jgi:RHS repeat-associated protein